jgi:precorrin isomerase
MVHPIEVESYRILSDRLDLSGLRAGPRAVVERVIHASADLEYAESMVVSETALDAGVAAIQAGAPIITDVEMTRAGITGVRATCYLHEVREGEPTRSASAVRLVASRHADGCVFVVGCAPTALTEAVSLFRAGLFRPALVVGLPVGFVGAAESKELLRDSGMACISNIGEKGGSAVAAAAINAMVRLARA